MSGKQLEIMKEMLPKLSRVRVIGNSANPGDAQALRETVLAAGAYEVYLRYLDVHKIQKDIEPMFRAAAKGRADALLVLGNPILNLQRTTKSSTSSAKSTVAGGLRPAGVYRSRRTHVLRHEL